MTTEAERKINEWQENVLHVTEDLTETHEFNGPRVELTMSEDLIVEIIVRHGGRKTIKWCYQALKLLKQYEESVQSNVNSEIKILTPGETQTLDRLKGIVDLRDDD